ncbi:MAG: DUF2314 domain-containing protein [Hyphomonadaceae bacterium]|nr:DUF2314 domain-containing protein [Hyphomonadaceae bacterium]
MKRVVIVLAASMLFASPAFAQKGGGDSSRGSERRGDAGAQASSGRTTADPSTGGDAGREGRGPQGDAGQSSSGRSTVVAPPTPGGNGIVFFDENDAAMAAAIEEARRTYPQFLADFGRAPPFRQGDYMVKVAMPTPDGGEEHIWVDNLRRDGERLFGMLANEPGNLPGMHLGSPVEIDHARISDWSISGSEGMYGNYTTRVMLPHMNQAEAEALRESLSRTPLPLDWTT